MDAITLHTAAVDNGGTRREAGDTVSVGTGKEQIDADRAKALIDAGSAVSKAARPK